MTQPYENTLSRSTRTVQPPQGAAFTQRAYPRCESSFDGDVMDFLQRELALFSAAPREYVSPLYGAAWRVARHLAPVHEGRLPAAHQTALSSNPGAARFRPRIQARIEGCGIPMWRLTREDGTGFLHKRKDCDPPLGQISPVHSWLLLGPQHTGLPTGKDMLCGCDDPRMLSMWFPKGSQAQGLRLELWSATPLATWIDGGLQATFHEPAALLLGSAALSSAAALFQAAFDAESAVRDVAQDLMDLGFGPGGLHARWEMAMTDRLMEAARKTVH